MKIEVGEWVRTNSGDIAKVVEFKDELVLDKEIKFHGIYRMFLNDDELNFVVSHSKNIIDLIQEGDYVNGKKIDAIIDFEIKGVGVPERVLCFEIDFPIEKGLRAYRNCDIKSIVTSQQFSSVEYLLEEE